MNVTATETKTLENATAPQAYVIAKTTPKVINVTDADPTSMATLEMENSATTNAKQEAC